MEYYVLVSDGCHLGTLTYYESKELAELVAEEAADKLQNKYVEYGITNYNGWTNSTIAVLKNEATE